MKSVLNECAVDRIIDELRGFVTGPVIPIRSTNRVAVFIYLPLASMHNHVSANAVHRKKAICPNS